MGSAGLKPATEHSISRQGQGTPGTVEMGWLLSSIPFCSTTASCSVLHPRVLVYPPQHWGECTWLCTAGARGWQGTCGPCCTPVPAGAAVWLYLGLHNLLDGQAAVELPVQGSVHISLSAVTFS